MPSSRWLILWLAGWEFWGIALVATAVAGYNVIHLWIRWRAKPRPHSRTSHSADTAAFRLLWGSGAEPTAPVPAAALTPAADSSGVS